MPFPGRLAPFSVKSVCQLTNILPPASLLCEIPHGHRWHRDMIILRWHQQSRRSQSTSHDRRPFMFGTTRTQKLVTVFAGLIMAVTVIAAVAISPGKPKNSTTSQSNSGQSDQSSSGESVTLTGTSYCAKCDFGVRPLNSSELGYALKTDSGTIAVIEDVHEQHASTYQDRFSNHQATVTGTVIKRSDNVVWIQPSSLVVSK